jgi:RNA polymerase sigma factor (sigma-70 family)
MAYTADHIQNELIESCRRNDRKAQMELYRLYYKSMYNTALRIVGDPMDAEDVMQEAFLAAFSHIKEYEGVVSFGAWLKRIVINRSIDLLKKRRIRFESFEDHKGLNPADDEPEGDEAAVTADLIRKGISLLPEGYRIILSLYLIEGYDHEEISGILRISESTSRSQLSRAKRKLLEILN